LEGFGSGRFDGGGIANIEENYFDFLALVKSQAHMSKVCMVSFQRILWVIIS